MGRGLPESLSTELAPILVSNRIGGKLTQMRFVYTPSDVPEWIHLFNDLDQLNGYPDERDTFHPHKDLKYCIDSLIRLFESVEVLNEYKVTLKLQVTTKKVSTSQEFFDGYELEQTDFVERYIDPIQKGYKEFDILPAEKVMTLRKLLKAAMIEMLNAVPMLVGKELRITTLEENNRKYGDSEAPQKF